MNVNKKIERITPNTLICGIDVGKTKCCARFCEIIKISKKCRLYISKLDLLLLLIYT